MKNEYKTIVCAPWTGQAGREHWIMIQRGVVYVYDPVAGHYTTCHNLTLAQVSPAPETFRDLLPAQ